MFLVILSLTKADRKCLKKNAVPNKNLPKSSVPIISPAKRLSPKKRTNIGPSKVSVLLILTSYNLKLAYTLLI